MTRPRVTAWTLALLLMPLGRGVAAGDPPGDVVATPETSLSLQIRWTDRTDGELGFLIEESRSGAEWRRAAITPANATSFTLRGRLPETAYRYRIRPFAQALMAPSPEITVRTPALTAPERHDGTKPMRCTSFDEVSQEGDATSWRILIRDGHVLDLVESSGAAEQGTETSEWRLFGEADCYRELGTAPMRWPPWDVLEATTATSGGWPLIVTSNGSDSAPRVEVRRLIDGAFEIVDSYPTCTDRHVWNYEDPPASPVRVSCQYMPMR